MVMDDTRNGRGHRVDNLVVGGGGGGGLMPPDAGKISSANMALHPTLSTIGQKI